MKNPGRDLPIAIVGGVSVIMGVYFIINISYLWVLPASELVGMTAPASAVALKIFGDVGGKIVSVGIMISVFGACNGFGIIRLQSGIFPGSGRSISHLASLWQG